MRNSPHLLAVALTLGACGGTNALERHETAPARPLITDPNVRASQGTIGPRVSSGPRVQIIAVIYDAQGERSTIDLGTYDGQWTREPAAGEEVVRGTVRGSPDSPALNIIVSE